jgi:flagellar basal body rod protein FlgC
MGSAMSIAASGMQAAVLRLDAAASNIVNNDSDAYRPVSVSQSPSADGGIRASLRPATPLLAFDPGAPYAMQGSEPHMDLPTELVNLKLAEHGFRASLLAYKASSEMFKTLLDATA